MHNGCLAKYGYFAKHPFGFYDSFTSLPVIWSHTSSKHNTFFNPLKISFCIYSLSSVNFVHKFLHISAHLSKHKNTPLKYYVYITHFKGVCKYKIL